MANAVRGAAVALRPHGKAHKCPDIAFAQIERGAVGICCQKVGEAEAFVAAGVRDVLVTNEIVGAAKLARLAAMAKNAKVGVLADDAGRGPRDRRRGERGRRDHLGIGRGQRRREPLRRRARRAGRGHRAGRRAHAGPVLRRNPCLSRRRAAPARRRRRGAPRSRRRCALVREAKAAIEAAGIACPTVTGAGTGTWQHERDSGVYTELQPGSYVFMDADYQKNALAPDQHHFEQSLFVLATVMSAPAPRTRGRRRGVEGASPSTRVFREVYGARGLDVREGDRRAWRRRRRRRKRRRRAIGDRLWLVPGHCDPTVNLYDWIVGVRGTRVECVWPVAARGALA